MAPFYDFKLHPGVGTSHRERNGDAEQTQTLKEAHRVVQDTGDLESDSMRQRAQKGGEAMLFGGVKPTWRENGITSHV